MQKDNFIPNITLINRGLDNVIDELSTVVYPDFNMKPESNISLTIKSEIAKTREYVHNAFISCKYIKENYNEKLADITRSLIRKLKSLNEISIPYALLREIIKVFIEKLNYNQIAGLKHYD